MDMTVSGLGRCSILVVRVGVCGRVCFKSSQVKSSQVKDIQEIQEINSRSNYHLVLEFKFHFKP